MLKAKSGLNTTGFFEMRSGRGPDFDTLFDDREKPEGDKRDCPSCKQHKLGNLKQAGVLIKK